MGAEILTFLHRHNRIAIVITGLAVAAAILSWIF
jgi:hypothetical protein